MASSSPGSDGVRRYSAWVHGLARRMVGDPDLADDLAQETLLKALVVAPRHGSMRAWLAEVMRNVVRQDLRAQRRRRAREVLVAALPNEGARVDRAEAVHELLSEALASLDEPFRTALRLRYYEGAGIREIARRTGVPENTVRSRLRRGLRRMRTDLTRLLPRIDGSDRRFLGALLLAPRGGLGRRVAGSSSSALYGFAMNVKWKLLVAGALVVGGVAIVPRMIGPHAPPAGPSPLAGPGPLVRAPDPSPATAKTADGRGPERSALAVEAPLGPESESSAAQPGRTLRAFVLGPDARPLTGVEVELQRRSGERTPLVSAASGELNFALDADERGTLACTDERFATILAAEVDPSSEVEPVLVVARAIRVSGVVQSDVGEPLAEARVQVRMPPDFERRFERVLDASVAREIETTSGPSGADPAGSGRFELGRVPAVPGAELVTRKVGFVEDVRPVPLADAELAITLQVLDPRRGDLAGIVLDPGGSPVAGACVSAAGVITRTDSQGRFVFPPEIRATARHVVALQVGFLPARAEPVTGIDGPRWPDFLELQLGGAPLTIEGTVVREDGTPLSGVRVWIDDPTHFGVEEQRPLHLEGMVGGARPASELEREGTSIRSSSNAFWSWHVTDTRGRFRLEGLLPRTYRVKAMQMDSLLHVVREDVAAGTSGLRMELALARDARRWAGVVVTDTGPVEGATVLAMHRAFRVEYGAGTSTSWDVDGPETSTDANGRFEFETLPAEAWFYVSGEGIAGKALFPGPLDRPEELIIRVERNAGTAHFRVELIEPARADHFALFDGEGESVEVALIRGGARVTTREAALAEGSSFVYAVREGRYELVLLREENEVERRWITLTPGELTTIRM